MQVRVDYLLSRDFLVIAKIYVWSDEIVRTDKMFFAEREGEEVIVDPDRFEEGTNDRIERKFESVADAQEWVGNILSLLRSAIRKIQKRMAELPETSYFDVDGKKITPVEK